MSYKTLTAGKWRRSLAVSISVKCTDIPAHFPVFRKSRYCVVGPQQPTALICMELSRFEYLKFFSFISTTETPEVAGKGGHKGTNTCRPANDVESHLTEEFLVIFCKCAFSVIASCFYDRFEIVC